jgi:aldose 1-epimerase
VSPDDIVIDAPVDIVWGDPEPARSAVETDLFRGRPLVPFADRIADGSYAFRGVSYHLPANDTTMGDAIHGFLYRTALDTVVGTPERSVGGVDTVGDSVGAEGAPAGPEQTIALAGEISPRPGYPWCLIVHLRYILRDSEFVFRIRVTNGSEEVAPVSVGWHPYFIAPGLGTGEAIDAATLVVPASEYLEVDDRLRLTGHRRGVGGTAVDFRVPRVIGPDEIDIGLVGATGATLAGPTGRIEIETGGTFSMIQLFVPPTRDAIAIEPFSAPGAAFQHPDLGLTTLAPGRSLDAWVVVTLKGAGCTGGDR